MTSWAGTVLEVVGALLVVVAAFAADVLLGVALVGVLMVAVGFVLPDKKPAAVEPEAASYR